MGTEDETQRLPENEVIPTEEGFDVEETGETGSSKPISGWGTTTAALVIALLALGAGLGIGYLL